MPEAGMKREVKRELLDELPPGDNGAIVSRRDLQKVNALMGHVRIMARVLNGAFQEQSPRTIVELGAGDGTLLLRLAKAIGPRWSPVRVVLVDRLMLVSARTKAEFAALSWHIESVQMDVFEWLGRPNQEPSDLTIVSLFLHHFKEDDLRRLLRQASGQTGFFLACEPWRIRFSLFAAGLVRLIGCNGVTRHDAQVSVRAGFAENELSSLWPADDGWRLAEHQALPFTHCFVAQRAAGARS
jgi:hypothetical protein